MLRELEHLGWIVDFVTVGVYYNEIFMTLWGLKWGEKFEPDVRNGVRKPYNAMLNLGTHLKMK